MDKLFRACVVGVVSLAVFGVTAANAEHRDRNGRDSRPQYCDIEHDHRSHDRNYYNYYEKDRYYRANRSYSTSTRYNSRRYGNRYGRGDRYNDRDGYDGRIVSRRTHRIPGVRATAYIVEREFHSGRGHRRVCNVSVGGPDAHYVERRDLRWVASTHCSRYARIRYS